MKSIKLLFLIAVMLGFNSSPLLACEYKQGETRFVDYANCRYGEDVVVTVDLPDSSAWEKCIYQAEAFRPAKLLAVTREEGGREMLSINDRSKIGNPCYMTKSQCDTALKAAGY